MKTPLIAAVLFSVIAPAAAFASQDCPNVPRDQWMSDAAITEIQRLVRSLVPEGVSVVDELIADRRTEAAKE